MKLLTIGMATYQNFTGVYQTIQDLRLHHIRGLQKRGWNLEIVVIDNDGNPEDPNTERLTRFCNHIKGGIRSGKQPGYRGWPQIHSIKYEAFRDAVGTAPPRNRVFEVAEGDLIFCVDDHINFMPDSLERLVMWADQNWDCPHLLQGPMMLDPLDSFHTHFDDYWREGMWGIWGTDHRGQYLKGETEGVSRQVAKNTSFEGDAEVVEELIPSADPFEIPAQGLGVFGCFKGRWLGFNKFFREFGGEEFYIHTKYRQAGHKVLCLPFLRWPHRFFKEDARPYPLSTPAKVRNYILGHNDLGLPLDRPFNQFVMRQNETDGSKCSDYINRGLWDTIVSNPVAYPIPRGNVIKQKGDCPGCPNSEMQIELPPEPEEAIRDRNRKKATAMEKRFTRAKDKDQGGIWYASADYVREKAGEALRILDIAPACDYTSAAILINEGKEVRYQYDQRSALEPLLFDKTTCSLKPLSQESPNWTADLGVIHGYHSAHQEQVRNRIETASLRCDRVLFLVTPGRSQSEAVKADDGKRQYAGMAPLIRFLLQKHPEYSVIYNDRENFGRILISRIPEDKPAIKPGIWQQAWTFGKANLEQAGKRFLTEEEAEPRKDECFSCEKRNGNQCSECGCMLFVGKAGLPGKIYYPGQTCPVGRWLPIKLEGIPTGSTAAAPPAEAVGQAETRPEGQTP
jgi:hypothetical protein